MSATRDAIENWIRAEREFRLGKRAYSDETAEWLHKAEKRMRRLVTGKGLLLPAYRELVIRSANNEESSE